MTLPGSRIRSESGRHPPLSLPLALPSPLHICFHFPRPWDITLRSHIKSILSAAPHLINQHLRIFTRPSYRASSEALLILLGTNLGMVEHAVDLFVKSLLERGWAVGEPKDESRDLRGYTNIYLVQQFTQRAVLSNTNGRVDRFTATGTLLPKPIVEDYTPVSQSTDVDWLAQGGALLEEERRRVSLSSSSSSGCSERQIKGITPSAASSQTDRPMTTLQQAASGVPTRRRRFRARVSNAVGNSGVLSGMLRKLGGGA